MFFNGKELIRQRRREDADKSFKLGLIAAYDNIAKGDYDRLMTEVCNLAIENDLLKRTIKQYSGALDKQFQVKSNEPSKLTKLKEVIQAFFYDKFGRVSNKYVTTGILKPKKFSFLGFRRG